MAKSKWYVVWEGRQPGVYKTWAECQAQTSGFPQAKFKAYESEAEAKAMLAAGWKKAFSAAQKAGVSGGAGTAGSRGGGARAAADAARASGTEADLDSLSVDVGCSGNPGIVEYKGVHTRTGEVLFEHAPISKGTNNMGEFLAIVHGLAYLKQKGSSMTIYSDSMTAIAWVRNKKVASTLVRDASTKEIWTLVDRAEEWIRQNTWPNKILKWNTKAWGEIKADYGRK
ncbi:ribonuclease H [Paenibacillus mucilaginosus]|uniref:Ribonuclease H n=1 Tax=Paenibacillus mucilaginosus (strain KNP414) TaxID=1036673 RepID=F8FPC9_PAEMK|nr:ribonuclease H family protein [Paenibacillus mucilaginosus]AEI39079.1 RnhA [Paenibacillus mucilaginosus KNP414]MCG7216207.1 ribonuclease H family protein [Paenibacillus mucilaginosus]WDM28107.1 ribonuclease H family protein [Paenibacillus mucilaginosus]